MRRYACCAALVLVAALAASPGRGGAPVIDEIIYEGGRPGMLEDAGWAGGGTGGRHVTIRLTTPTAGDVTMVRFKGVNVNDAIILPATSSGDFRFDVLTDKQVTAGDVSDDYAIRVEVPPRIWPFDTMDRKWKADIPIVVENADGASAPFNYFHYLQPIVVKHVMIATDHYIWSGDTSVYWRTEFMPEDENFVTVVFDNGIDAPITLNGPSSLLVGPGGGSLLVTSVPDLDTSTLGTYAVTITAFLTEPVNADESSTSAYSLTGDDIVVEVIHPPATVTGVWDAAGTTSIQYVPIGGNVLVTVEGDNYYEPDVVSGTPGTEVTFDDVAATIDTYAPSNDRIRVWVPPCPEGTERDILLGVNNYPANGQAYTGTLAYWDYAPTVRMLAPESGLTPYSGAVLLQADARDDVSVTKVEYWAAPGSGGFAAHYDPTDVSLPDAIRVAFNNDTWAPASDTSWTAAGEWVLVGTVNGSAGWPYTCDTWLPTDGNYTVVAVAYDSHQTTSVNSNGTQTQLTALPVEIRVDPAGVNPPEVIFVSPPDGADIFPGGGNVLLSASATEPNTPSHSIADIQFFFIDSNGSKEPLGFTDQNTPGEGGAATLNWDGYINDPSAGTLAPAGSLYLVAEAISTTGRVGYAGVAVNIVDDADTDVSIVSITPAATDYAGAVSGSETTLTIYGSGFVETGGQAVTVYFGGQEADDLNVVSSTELTVTVPHISPGLEEGAVTLRVKVTDSEDAVLGFAERGDLFTVYDSPPTISFLSPSNNAQVGDGIVIVAKAVDDRGVVNVVFEVDDGNDVSREPLGTVNGYPYSVVWDMSDPDPSTMGGWGFPHTIYATVSDGTNTVEETIIVYPELTVFNNPPIVTVSPPRNGTTVSGVVDITVTITNDDSGVVAGRLSIVDGGTGLEVTDGSITYLLDPGTPVLEGSVYVSTFTAEWDTTDFADGSFYRIEASSTDTGGNTGVGGVNVTIGDPVRQSTGSNGCHHDTTGQDAGVPLAWLLAMLVGAVPFLATRRIWRASQQRVR